MAEHVVRAYVDKAQTDCQLQKHIQQTDLYMPYLQLICHQLESMFPVRLTQVLVEHDAMDNRAAAIHAINQQEDQICHILRKRNEATNQEQQDISHTYRPYISGEAFGLALRPEVEEAAAEHCQQCPSADFQ